MLKDKPVNMKKDKKCPVVPLSEASLASISS